MTAWLLALALAVAPVPSAISRAAADAAEQALTGAPPQSAVGIWVDAATPELKLAVGSALVDAVRERGARSAIVIEARDANGAAADARARGCDVLIRVRVGVDDTALTIAGDRIGTWANFWNGATPQPQLPSAPIAARAAADAIALTLARVVVAAPVAPAKLALQMLGHVPARIVALALVDADGDGHPEIAALTPSELLILKPSGEILFRRDHTQLPERARRTRVPCGGLVSPDGARGHRLLYAYSDLARGESLVVDTTGLHPTGLLDATPLAVGPAGVISAQDDLGTNRFGSLLDPAGAPHGLGKEVVALSANPRTGEPAYLAALADGEVQPLSASYASSAPPLPGGISALADLDGDGRVELVLSSPQTMGTADHVRVLEPGSAGARFEADVAGSVVAATAGDLDGDGKDDVVMAALLVDGTTALLRIGMQP